MPLRHINLRCRPRLVSSIDKCQRAFGLKMACSLPRVRLCMYHFGLARISADLLLMAHWFCLRQKSRCNRFKLVSSRTTMMRSTNSFRFIGTLKLRSYGATSFSRHINYCPTFNHDNWLPTRTWLIYMIWCLEDLVQVNLWIPRYLSKYSYNSFCTYLCPWLKTMSLQSINVDATHMVFTIIDLGTHIILMCIDNCHYYTLFHFVRLVWSLKTQVTFMSINSIHECNDDVDVPGECIDDNGRIRWKHQWVNE